jgi:type VI protein secretion system component Hcp
MVLHKIRIALAAILVAVAAVSAADSASAASGGGAGKVIMQDFQFTMTVNISSPFPQTMKEITMNKLRIALAVTLGRKGVGGGQASCMIA